TAARTTTTGTFSKVGSGSSAG
ncbi:MAG: hypothetical protein AVDCRST_MAG93-1265, partial [uncultured Chloroflexia bacterium]